jgi:hypothetical protein
MKEAGVRVASQEIAERIEPDSVAVCSIWGGGERTIPADTVILSMMRRSDDALARELAASGVDATSIGDCVAPREVDDATYEGLAHGRAIPAS